MLRRYVHGPGIDEPIVWYEGSGTSDRRWFVADERGSIIAIADNGGDATDVNTYDEFGRPDSSNAGRFQYTGQMWLGEVGLYHYRARAYSPELGRFLQTDPILYAGGMNLYAYVGNDPVNFTDPWGLQQGEDIITITGRKPWHELSPGASPSFLGFDDRGDPPDEGVARGNAPARICGNQPGSRTPVCRTLVNPDGTPVTEEQLSQLLLEIIQDPNAPVGLQQAAFALRSDIRSAELWGEFAIYYSYAVAAGSVVGGLRIAAIRYGPAVAESIGNAVGYRSWLFGRGTGVLNSNNYIRLGWGWSGSATQGQRVFRLAIGKKGWPIHWHFP